MNPLPKHCEDLNAVRSFCDCIRGTDPVDAAAGEFCRRAEDKNAGATGDELIELKKALKDLEEPDPDECCCDC